MIVKQCLVYYSEQVQIWLKLNIFRGHSVYAILLVIIPKTQLWPDVPISNTNQTLGDVY